MKRHTFLQGIGIVTALPAFSIYLTRKSVAETVNSMLVDPLDKPHEA